MRQEGGGKDNGWIRGGVEAPHTWHVSWALQHGDPALVAWTDWLLKEIVNLKLTYFPLAKSSIASVFLVLNMKEMESMEILNLGISLSTQPSPRNDTARWCWNGKKMYN